MSSQDREALLREIIRENERDLERDRERLDDYRIEEAKLRFSAEILEEHGDLEEAQRVRIQLHDAEHRTKSADELVQRIERLLTIYREKLQQLQRERQTGA